MHRQRENGRLRKMGLKFLLLPTVLLSLTIASTALANEAEDSKTSAIALKLKLQRSRIYLKMYSNSKLSRLREIEKFSTDANWLTQKPTSKIDSTQPQSPQVKEPTVEHDDELDIEVVGERETFTETSSPVYIVPKEEIEKQRPNSVAEILRNLPGFAINDVGFGADIHTGTYYRGSSINQSVFFTEW